MASTRSGSTFPRGAATIERRTRRGNSATHKTEPIKRCLLKHPGVHLHFTRTSAAWLNLVECWFSFLQRRARALPEFTSPEALEAVLHDYIAAFNADPKPFVWTESAEEILASVRRFCQRTSHSLH